MSSGDDYLDLDDVTKVAMEETKKMLEEAESILFHPLNKDSVGDLFRKIHTSKSNMSVVPGSRTLSVLLQNFESSLSKLRDRKELIDNNRKDLFLEFIYLSLKLIDNIEIKMVDPLLEKEVYKLITKFRLNRL